MNVTVITDEARDVEADREGDRLLVALGDLDAATGWKLEDQGLCRGEVCVPVPDRSELVVGDRVDLAALGRALHRPTAVDAGEGVVAMAEPAAERAAALQSLAVADVTLPELDGEPVSLRAYAGKKKLLVAWASW